MCLVKMLKVKMSCKLFGDLDNKLSKLESDIYSETSMQIAPVALQYLEVQKVAQRIHECK